MTQDQVQQQLLAPATQQAIFQTSLKNVPVALSGKGIYVDIRDPKTGKVRTVIDANSGAAVSSVGHGDEEIKEKMIEAVNDQIYNYPLLTANDQSEKLAQFLLDNSPKGAFDTATFVGSGSEANENAMKIIRKYHIENGDAKRIKFISRKQSYHGFTIGALSISDNVRKYEFSDILLSPSITPKVSQLYPYRYSKDGETLEEYKDRLLQEIEDTFIKEGPETIAAFLCETVTGSTFGCQVPIPGYLDGIREICHKYGAIFFLDEVMCGLGRMGSFHAWEQYLSKPTDSELSIGPDIQTNGKTLGAGYVTIASILISPKVMKVFKEKKSPPSGAQTYHSHAFNCQVALAVQEKVKKDQLIDNMKTVGNYFGKTLREKTSHFKTVGEVRGNGGFWAIEFVKNKETRETFEIYKKYGVKFNEKALENGIFQLGFAGTADGYNGEHALFSPAFSITKPEADEIVRIVVKTLEELEDEFTRNGDL